MDGLAFLFYVANLTVCRYSAIFSMFDKFIFLVVVVVVVYSQVSIDPIGEIDEMCVIKTTSYES